MKSPPSPPAPVPRIAITPGEPAGIGPDLCVLLAQPAHAAELVIVADPALLAARAAQLGLPLAQDRYDSAAAPVPPRAGRLRVAAVPLRAAVQSGELNPLNAAYVLDTLRAATQGCMSGEFAALVTGPVHKGVIDAAGFAFSGHTEFLADLTRTPQVVMMLLPAGLRVALATTQLPLRDEADANTPPQLEGVLRNLPRA